MTDNWDKTVPGLESRMNLVSNEMTDTMWKTNKRNGWEHSGFRDDKRFHGTFYNNELDHIKNQLTGERFFTHSRHDLDRIRFNRLF